MWSLITIQEYFLQGFLVAIFHVISSDFIVFAIAVSHLYLEAALLFCMSRSWFFEFDADRLKYSGFDMS